MRYQMYGGPLDGHVEGFMDRARVGDVRVFAVIVPFEFKRNLADLERIEPVMPRVYYQYDGKRFNHLTGGRK